MNRPVAGSVAAALATVPLSLGAQFQSFLTGEITRAHLFPWREEEFQHLQLHRVQGQASGLDSAGHRLLLINGAAISYDRLLLATGSAAIRPNLPGIDLPQVVTLDNLADAERILALASKVRYVVDPSNPYPRAYTGHVRFTLADGRMVEERQPFIRGGFHDDKAGGPQPVSIDLAFKRTHGQPLSIGWIQENKVEWPVGICGHLSKRSCIATPDFGDACRMRCLDIAPDQSAALEMVINEHHEVRSARQRLEAHRAGATEDVEHARLVQRRGLADAEAVLEDVEQRLARAVARRPDRSVGRRVECRAAMPAGDDAHAPAAAGQCRGAGFAKSPPICSRTIFGGTSSTAPGARWPSWNGP
jgi:hypothetical protein